MRWTVIEAASFKIVVNVEMREDGGLRVWSADVPGLVLSHQDPQKVIDDIKPALETILSALMGCEVRADPLRPLQEMLDERNRAQAAATQAPTSRGVSRRARPARPETPISIPRKTLEYAAQPCQ